MGLLWWLVVCVVYGGVCVVFGGVYGVCVWWCVVVYSGLCVGSVGCVWWCGLCV